MCYDDRCRGGEVNVRKNEAAARKKQEQQVLQAFLNERAVMLQRKEVHELKDIKNEDGSVKRELVLTKVVSKEVPPILRRRGGTWKGRGFRSRSRRRAWNWRRREASYSGENS